MLYWLVNTIVRFILHILLKLDTSELDQIPERGPLIAAANHVNFLDAPVMITHLDPRPTTGLIKKETWDSPLMAFLFNVWEGIPIDRTIADFSAFKEAKKALAEGRILAVAPEGTRSEDGRLIRGKPGIAILASQCDVPIFPIAYFGHEEFKHNFRRLKRTPMVVKVGKPFRVMVDGREKNKVVMQGVADAIMLEIAALLPEEYHGVYAQISVEKEKYIQYLD